MAMVGLLTLMNQSGSAFGMLASMRIQFVGEIKPLSLPTSPGLKLRFDLIASLLFLIEFS